MTTVKKTSSSGCSLCRLFNNQMKNDFFIDNWIQYILVFYRRIAVDCRLKSKITRVLSFSKHKIWFFYYIWNFSIGCVVEALSFPDTDDLAFEALGEFIRINLEISSDSLVFSLWSPWRSFCAGEKRDAGWNEWGGNTQKLEIKIFILEDLSRPSLCVTMNTTMRKLEGTRLSSVSDCRLG